MLPFFWIEVAVVFPPGRKDWRTRSGAAQHPDRHDHSRHPGPCRPGNHKYGTGRIHRSRSALHRVVGGEAGYQAFHFPGPHGGPRRDVEILSACFPARRMVAHVPLALLLHSPRRSRVHHAPDPRHPDCRRPDRTDSRPDRRPSLDPGTQPDWPPRLPPGPTQRAGVLALLSGSHRSKNASRHTHPRPGRHSPEPSRSGHAPRARRRDPVRRNPYPHQHRHRPHPAPLAWSWPSVRVWLPPACGP
jgi:hypothetical protein